MRRLLLAVLAVPLIAAAPPRGTVALGVGASSSSEVIVKIAGKNVNVKLAGISNGTYAGQAFLQCLVASRIVRVDRAAGRVTLLDGTSVADHLAEFLQSRTSTDPCTLGKAAYVPQAPALASSVQVNPPTNGASAPGKREGHVSFGSGSGLSGGLDIGASPAPAAQRAPAKAPAAANDQPTIYNPPTMRTVTPQSTQTYTPQTQSTTTVGSTGTSTPPSTQTYTPPTASTTTIPTTTQPPP